MKAVIFGAGNIGRGFIGKTFSESGYEVCFVDIAQDFVEKLNADRCYPVKIVAGDSKHNVTVHNVRAVNARDASCVADEIAGADIMASAVGVNALPHIVKPICEGLKKRFVEGAAPLDMIICENLIDADHYLRRLIEDEMGAKYKAVLDQKLGLVEASIGRMVPVMTEEMREGNLLMVWVEPYDELPVDKAAFKGKIPKINGLVPFSPFGFYIKRKLYIHNMSHAMCAYLGWQKGYTYIYECVRDKEIREQVRAAMTEVSKALHREYGIEKKQLNAHVEDLLHRFGNDALGDTVARVARDPLRKLGSNDRLIGAALYCISQGCDPSCIVRCIAAALVYDNPSDEAAIKMRTMINESGVREFLISQCSLSEDSPLLEMLEKMSQCG